MKWSISEHEVLFMVSMPSVEAVRQENSDLVRKDINEALSLLDVLQYCLYQENLH